MSSSQEVEIRIPAAGVSFVAFNWTAPPDSRAWAPFLFATTSTRSAMAPKNDHKECTASDKADGKQAMWVDGKLVGEFTGIRWRNDMDLKVNCFRLEHYGYDEGDPTKPYWQGQPIRLLLEDDAGHADRVQPERDFLAFQLPAEVPVAAARTNQHRGSCALVPTWVSWQEMLSVFISSRWERSSL
jgi:hypothetical protein